LRGDLGLQIRSFLCPEIPAQGGDDNRERRKIIIIQCIIAALLTLLSCRVLLSSSTKSDIHAHQLAIKLMVWHGCRSTCCMTTESFIAKNKIKD